MIKKLTLSTMRPVLENNEKLAIVKFMHEQCYLCVGFEPVYEDLAREFKNNVSFYNVNIQEEPKLGELFAGSGVPTLCIFTAGGGQYVEIPDPEQSDEKTWFTKEYIKQCLEDFLRG